MTSDLLKFTKNLVIRLKDAYASVVISGKKDFNLEKYLLQEVFIKNQAF